MLKKLCVALLLAAAIVAEGQNEFNHRTTAAEATEPGETNPKDNSSGSDSESESAADGASPPAGEEGNTDDAETAASEPVAEKFIGSRRKRPHPEDLMREKMIGMIFTGEPQPLGVRPRLNERRRYYSRPRPEFITERQHDVLLKDYPKQILKPMPFIPRRSNLEFPMPVLQGSASRHPSHFVRGPPPKSLLNLDPDHPIPSRRERRPDSRERKPFRRFPEEDSFAVPKDIFSNTVGPDFGPVTFEDFGTNFESNLNEFDFPRVPKKPHKVRPHPPFKPNFKPPKTDPGSPFGFSNTKFGGFDEIQKFEEFPALELGPDGCHKYTEDICLDTDNYPHEEILTSLARDPSRAGNLMAEVRDQSADDLVDGISAAQEAKYDYNHYYGNRFANRRGSSQKAEPRDFAEDGGYLCPSEVKYARPKRARNSKGKWKFIVNMDKYSQTIRMEKCMKPGGSCSYVSHHYRATCNQVYNYQRLLSWEKKRGLHMDIFKVPSCCACHIQGYAFVFPPLHRSDSELAGSERVDQYLPANSKGVESIHQEAPPFSPINYPNLLPNIEGRMISENLDREKLVPMNTSQRKRRPGRRERDPHDGPVSRSNAPISRVNYEYHPIIDFFEGSPESK